MPFLGKQPTAGFSTIVKDDLTPDGSTTAFTLSKQVASANDIAVFVGNVRQEPTDAYTVNGTTLTMTAAPASGINFYVLHIAGTHESSVVPADNTISTAKIQASAITDAKIAGMSSSKLTGALPALDGSALTGIDPVTTTAAVDLTGGYATTFDNIPSTATRIRLSMYGISTTSASTSLTWRLGNSASWVTTGYKYFNGYINMANPTTGTSNNYNTDRFALDGWGSASNAWTGYIDFHAFDLTSTNRIWLMDMQVFNEGFNQYQLFYKGYVSMGDKSSTPLTRLIIYENGNNNFDGNSAAALSYI